MTPADELEKQIRQHNGRTCPNGIRRKAPAIGGDHTSVDGTYLTDMGFYMLAEGLEPKLKEILVNTGGVALGSK